MEIRKPSFLGVEYKLPKVAGPYTMALAWTGFDFRCFTRTAGKIEKIIRVMFVILLLVFFFLAILVDALANEKPFSIEWADRQISTFLAAYGFISGICLIFWTKNDFLTTYQEELAKVKSHRKELTDKIDNYKKLTMGTVVFSFFTVISYSLASQKNIIYQLTKSSYNRTENYKFMFEKRNMFGTLPAVYLWMGPVCAIATCIFWLAHAHLTRELEYFNEEFRSASKAGDFQNQAIFVKFGARHRLLMTLLDLVNSNLGKMSMANCFTSAGAFCFALYLQIGFINHLSVPYRILIYILGGIPCHMMTILIAEPAKVQKQVYHTKKILMEDAVLPIATDQKIISSYHLFKDRCDHATKIHLLGAIPINRKTFHWVIFVVPNLGMLLVFCAKLYGVIEI